MKFYAFTTLTVLETWILNRFEWIFKIKVKDVSIRIYQIQFIGEYLMQRNSENDQNCSFPTISVGYQIWISQIHRTRFCNRLVHLPLKSASHKSKLVRWICEVLFDILLCFIETVINKHCQNTNIYISIIPIKLNQKQQKQNKDTKPL